MTETKHSPLPWRAHLDEHGYYRIKSGSQRLIASDLDESEAKIIVRAVNAHDQLLAACKAALRVIDECIPVTQPVPVPGISVQLRNAIAAAE